MIGNVRLPGVFSLKADAILLFRNAGLFNGLTDATLRKAASLATSGRLNRGQILFYEHERASGVYIVSQGGLRSFRQDAEGREQTLSIARCGAVVGLSALFSGGTFFSTTIANSAAEIFCIEKHDVEELCREDPGFVRNAARMLANQVREFARVIESLALRSVEQRVAEYLVLVAQESGIENGMIRVMELPLTRSAIASRVGSTREVVSRAFSHLETLGLIQTKDRRILAIPDMAALSEFSGVELSSSGPGFQHDESLEGDTAGRMWLNGKSKRKRLPRPYVAAS